MKELDFNKKVIYEFADKVDQLKVRRNTRVGSNFYNKDLYCSFSKGRVNKNYLKKED